MVMINEMESFNEQQDNESTILLQNYSVLLNKLEQLAFDVNKELELASVSNVDFMSNAYTNSTGSGSGSSSMQPHISFTHGLEEIEYTRVVSDIWIGIILTLLIICVIILICVGFLYHKFQQWKLSYRSNRNREPVEICRNYSSNYEVESLPSYTIVSGLPTYDDALEEFRKAGIILTPQIPIIKVFEVKDAKTKDLCDIENENTCTCASASNAGNLSTSINASTIPAIQLPPSASTTNQLIELTPEQLAKLCEKRLPLQITFGSQRLHNSRSRQDIRNHLLRSRLLGNNSTTSTGTTAIDVSNMAPHQRPLSSPSFSVSTINRE